MTLVTTIRIRSNEAYGSLYETWIDFSQVEMRNLPDSLPLMEDV
jgi:hypothetical protein